MSPEEWLARQQGNTQTVQTVTDQGVPVTVDVTIPGAEEVPATQPLSPEEWLAATSQEAPETTAAGVVGALARGLAPVASGAALGAALGAPTGVGVVPGALAGAGAATLATVIGDPIVSLVNNLFGTKYTMPTQALEDLLSRIGVAQPKTEAERIIRSIAGGAGSAAGISAVGQALSKMAASPVTREVGRQLGAEPLAQVAAGAGAGATSQIAQELGFGPVGQIIAGVAGSVAGARAVTPRAPIQLPSDLEEAQRNGIKVLTSDVVKPRTFAQKWLQTVGERVPITGTGPIRRAQQEQRINAVRDLANEYGVTDQRLLSKKIWEDLAHKRRADITKYKTMKDEVIGKISRGQVELPQTLRAIDDEIAKLTSLKTDQLRPVINILKDWRASVQGQNLANVEMLRKQLGESFKAPELGAVRSIGEQSISSIYKALVDDMGNFIKANGDARDYTKWKVANGRLAEMMDEVNGTVLKAVLRKGDATPEAVNQMLFSTKPSEIAQLYRNLTPEGRAAARVAIINRAIEKSGGIENISPDRFANQVQSLGKSINIFFSGEELKRIQGLARVIQLTQRAGEAAALPPTGVQNFYAMLGIGGGALGGGLTGAVVTAGAMGTVGAAARMYESEMVRNLLMKIPQTRPGSAEEAELVKRLMAAIAAQQQVSTPEEK